MHWQEKSAQFEKSASIPAPSTFINRQRDRIHPGRANGAKLHPASKPQGRTQASGGRLGLLRQRGGPGQSGTGDHPSRPDQDHDPNAATLAQAQTGGRASHRALEIGQPHTELLAARCKVQGATGDALHALCCAVGYNLLWLMRAVERLGLKGLLLCVLWLEQWARFAAALLTQDTTFTGSPSMRTGFASAPGFNRSK